MSVVVACGAFGAAGPPVTDQAPEVKDAQRFHALVPKDAKVEALGCDFRFTEGPVWVGGDEGYLLFSDITRSQLVKWTRGEGFSVCRKATNSANGNAIAPDGSIISCEQRARRVVRIGPDGKVTVVADRYEGKKFNCPNDVAAGSDGTLWFTDPRYGEWCGPKEMEGNYVYRVDAKTGTVSIAVRELSMPNGVALSPDETTLYVGQGGRGRMVTAYAIRADGRLGEGRKVCTVTRGVPDGLTRDREGNLYVTAGDGVAIFTANGEHLGTIRVQPRPSNVCFGGPGRQTLFITAHQCVFMVKLKAKGVEPGTASRAGGDDGGAEP
jgi:gluconolactonase